MQDFFYIIWKYWRLLAGFAIAFGLAAFTYGAIVGPRFTASGLLMVLQPGTARNEAEMLRDPGLIRGLPVQPPAGMRLETLYAQLGRALTVVAVPDTDIVEVRFTWRNPRFAADALNAFLGEQAHLASGEAAVSAAMALAQTRLRDAQAALDAADRRVAALPRVAGSAPDQGAIEREKDRIASRMTAARADAESLRLERDLAAKKLEAAEKSFAGGGWVDNPDAPISASGTPALDQTFIELLDKRGKLLAHLPPDSPQVKNLDSQIARAREHAYQNVRQVLGDRLHAVDERLASLAAGNSADEAALRSLDDQLVEVEALAGSRQEAAARVAEAGRQLDDLRRQSETAIRDAAGVRVLSQARPPITADFPQPWLVFWLSLPAGALAGLAAASWAERRRVTIDRPEDIARLLKIPVLASVPELR